MNLLHMEDYRQKLLFDSEEVLWTGSWCYFEEITNKLLYKKLSKYNKPKSGEKYFKYICFSSPLVGAGSEQKLVLIENFLLKVIKKSKERGKKCIQWMYEFIAFSFVVNLC